MTNGDVDSILLLENFLNHFAIRGYFLLGVRVANISWNFNIWIAPLYFLRVEWFAGIQKWLQPPNPLIADRAS